MHPRPTGTPQCLHGVDMHQDWLVAVSNAKRRLCVDRLTAVTRETNLQGDQLVGNHGSRMAVEQTAIKTAAGAGADTHHAIPPSTYQHCGSPLPGLLVRLPYPAARGNRPAALVQALLL